MRWLAQVLKFVQQHTLEGCAHLAGNSVHADLAFLKRYMPKVASPFPQTHLPCRPSLTPNVSPPRPPSLPGSASILNAGVNLHSRRPAQGPLVGVRRLAGPRTHAQCCKRSEPSSPCLQKATK